MPYISDKERRKRINKMISDNSEDLCSIGALNYLLCKMFNKLKLDYKTARAFIGEIECAKLEIYRRWVGPYEDKKKNEHGDV